MSSSARSTPARAQYRKLPTLAVLAGLLGGVPAPSEAQARPPEPILITDASPGTYRLRPPGHADFAPPVLVLRKDISEAEIDSLAHQRLFEVSPSPSGELRIDAKTAGLYLDNETANATVFAHYHDGVRVENSMVLVKREADGRIVFVDRLVAVQEPAGDIGEAAARQRGLEALRSSMNADRTSGWLTTPEFPVSAEPIYTLRTHSMRAQLGYHIRSISDTRVGSEFILDAATGDVVREDSSSDLNDDAEWSQLPFGTIQHPINPDKSCTYAMLPWGGFYYGALTYPFIQFHLNEPLLRLRQPELGLTTLRYQGEFEDSPKKWWELNEFIAYSHDDPSITMLNTCIGWPEHPLYPGNNSSDLAVQAHWALQDTMKQLADRFGWEGLHGDYSDILMVADVVDPKNRGCYVDLHENILCQEYFFTGAEKIPAGPPPVDVIAHEFGHSILKDKGLVYGATPESAALTEGLSDLIGAFVKHKWKPLDYWKIGEETTFISPVSEFKCKAINQDYCSTPLPMIRDLRYPRTNDFVAPAPSAYQGDHYVNDFAHKHRNGQVASLAVYLWTTGGWGCPNDDADCNDVSKPFYNVFPIGINSAMEIVWESLDHLSSNNVALKKYIGETLPWSAAYLCGEASMEQLSAANAAYAVGAAPAPEDYFDAGYDYPTHQAVDVRPLVKFVVKRYLSTKIEYQIAADIGFNNILYVGTVASIGDTAKFSKKLKPGTQYFWRVRDAEAAMLSRPFIEPLAGDVCWRPTHSFTTGPKASVDGLTPNDLQGPPFNEQAAWHTVLSWNPYPGADGYFYEVDYDESSYPGATYPSGDPSGCSPQYNPYKCQLASGKIKAEEIVINPEQPGAWLDPLAVRLPASNGIIFRVTPYMIDEDGNMLLGDPGGNAAFSTPVEETLLLTPMQAPDGTLQSYPAQPLMIEFDPADYAASHRLTLKATAYKSGAAPLGPLAYVDDGADPAADGHLNLMEPSNAQEWTSRSLQRMLPHAVKKSTVAHDHPTQFEVRVESTSPMIADPAEGAVAYLPFEETAEDTAEFIPDSSNALDLAPMITVPTNSGACADPTQTQPWVQWRHAAAANESAVSDYLVQRMRMWCSSANFAGFCLPWVDPISPDYEAAALPDLLVPHNGGAPGAIQDYIITADSLWSAANASDNFNGLSLQIYPSSGPEPGPPGLILGSGTSTYMPLLPDKLDVALSIDQGLLALLPQAAMHPGQTPLFAGLSPQPAPSNPDIEPMMVQQSVWANGTCSGDPLFSASSAVPSTVNLYGNAAQEALQDAGSDVTLSARIRYEAGGTCKAVESPCRTVDWQNDAWVPDVLTGLQGGQGGENRKQLVVLWNRPGVGFTYKGQSTGTFGNVLESFIQGASNQFVFDEASSQALWATGQFDHLPGAGQPNRMIGLITALANGDDGKTQEIKLKACKLVQGEEWCGALNTVFHTIDLPQQNQEEIDEDGVDLSSGIVQFEPTFWGQTALVWSGSTTPESIDHYDVTLSCEPDPGNGDPQYQTVTATTVLSQNAEYGNPPPPHAGWYWTSMWLDYLGEPQGTNVTCTAWVYACKADGTCGSGSNATGFGEVGDPECTYTGWNYNYDYSCSSQ